MLPLTLTHSPPCPYTPPQCQCQFRTDKLQDNCKGQWSAGQKGLSSLHLPHCQMWGFDQPATLRSLCACRSNGTSHPSASHSCGRPDPHRVAWHQCYRRGGVWCLLNWIWVCAVRFSPIPALYQRQMWPYIQWCSRICNGFLLLGWPWHDATSKGEAIAQYRSASIHARIIGIVWVAVADECRCDCKAAKF